MFLLMGFAVIDTKSFNRSNDFRTRIMPNTLNDNKSSQLKHLECPNCLDIKCLFMGNNFIQCNNCSDLFISSDELLEVYNKNNYHREIKHGVDLKIIEMD